MVDALKTSEPTDVVLIEEIGVSRIADALGISTAAVRKWRKTGIPDNRRQAVLGLADAKAAAAELLSLVDDETTISESDRDDQNLASSPEPALQQDASDTSVTERITRQRRRENAQPSSTRSQAQHQRTTAADGSRPRPSIAQKASAEAIQERKPVRLNRQAAIVVCSGLVAAIAIGLTQGLRDVSSSPAIGNEAAEQAPIYQDHVSAVLPDFDYRTLTRPTALTVIKEPPKNVEKSPISETAPAEPTQVKATTSARDPHAEEEEAALQSGLFPPGAPTSSAAAPRPASAVPRGQDNALAALEQLRQRLPTANDLLPKGQRSAADQRQSFLNAELDQSIYLKNGLQKPLSDYEIKAGTNIPAALITGLNSDLPGEIIGQVTEHIYDTATGQHLLIPQGAKIFGRYNADVGYGQERAQIIWDRLIMPEGSSVQLEAMVGTDKAGYAGLADQVDHHLGRLVGAVILSSFISVGANLATDTGDNVIDALGDTAAQQAAQVGGEIIDRQLNIRPTITVRPGFKLNILVNKDMILEPYPAG